MSTTIEEIGELLRIPKEHENIEFKEAKQTYDTVKLMRYCVGIANEGGGRFILGITDAHPRKVVGSQAYQDTQDIAARIYTKLRFRVDVEEVFHPDGRVVIFHIPSRPMGTAYAYEGSYLMRSTEDLVAMSEDRLRQIFAEGKPDWLSEVAREDCSADDIVRLLDTQSYFDLIEMTYPASREGVLARFESEGLIEHAGAGWSVMNLGAIAFAKDLQEFPGVSRKAMRLVVYKGTGKLDTRLDQVQRRGYASGFARLIDFVTAQIPTNEVIGKALRVDVKMYPQIALRELIANALIHQDFQETGTSSMIEIYDDRLEISNPGKPFIPPDRFIDEYKSRNEKLADLMRRLHICEEKGSGIDKVISSVEQFQLPAPDFRVKELRTSVVLFAHRDFEAMDRSDRVRACYQHCCLRYVTNQKMTNQSLRERFSLGEDRSETTSRIIRDTLDANLIKLDDPHSTSKRYARYVPYWA